MNLNLGTNLRKALNAVASLIFLGPLVLTVLSGAPQDIFTAFLFFFIIIFAGNMIDEVLSQTIDKIFSKLLNKSEDQKPSNE